MQPDTIIPDPFNPQSWNRYSYVTNRPINFNDPTGHIEACDKDDWACQYHWDIPIIPPKDDNDDVVTSNPQTGAEADVTAWLVAEMDSEASWLRSHAKCGWDQICLYGSHLDLFGDYGKYDIKRSMLTTIGDAVILCGGNGCKWVDYSAPGNIMYGYLSASRGVPQTVSWTAAGILEKRNSIKYGEPYTGEWSSWGDNPGDKAAVDFGYDLYKKYPNGLTLEDFQIELDQADLNSFQSPITTPNLPADPAPFQTYTWGEFLWPIKE